MTLPDEPHKDANGLWTYPGGAALDPLTAWHAYAVMLRDYITKSERRYQWWSENWHLLARGGGLETMAFDCQFPLDKIRNASSKELMDMVADHESELSK